MIPKPITLFPLMNPKAFQSYIGLTSEVSRNRYQSLAVQDYLGLFFISTAQGSSEPSVYRKDNCAAQDLRNEAFR